MLSLKLCNNLFIARSKNLTRQIYCFEWAFSEAFSWCFPFFYKFVTFLSRTPLFICDIYWYTEYIFGIFSVISTFKWWTSECEWWWWCVSGLIWLIFVIIGVAVVFTKIFIWNCYIFSKLVAQKEQIFFLNWLREICQQEIPSDKRNFYTNRLIILIKIH